jgi:hypothetical protein
MIHLLLRRPNISPPAAVQPVFADYCSLPELKDLTQASLAGDFTVSAGCHHPRHPLIFSKYGVCAMKQRRRIYYSAAQRSEIWDRWQAGEPMSSIGRRFDRESSSVFSVISPTGGIRPPARRRAREALRCHWSRQGSKLTQLLIVRQGPVFSDFDLRTPQVNHFRHSRPMALRSA